MNKKRAVLGIDTSNYTTSVSLVSLDLGELIGNFRTILAVKEGERGLRQSDAVFSHVKNIPALMQSVREKMDEYEISAVGVSVRPRNIDGSYMPCFLSGVSVAESVSASLGVPLFKFSHQCGHLMAAVYSSGRYDLLDGRDFAAFHVSGGTTEMLRTRFSDGAFISEIAGETSDLNAGQVIDRVGVMMGLPFPSGAYIEELALQNTKKIPKKKPSIKSNKISLSGLENMAEKLYKDTCDKALVSAFVLDYVGSSLISLAASYEEKYGKSEFLFAGGVMRNSIIRRMLSERFSASFAEPTLSSDNAVGIACLARLKTL